jgi:hypothetical protein
MSMPHPNHFTPRKYSQYPLYRRLGGPQGWPGRVWKISLPPGFKLQNIQPIAIHYTNYAILSALLQNGFHINKHNEIISKQCVIEHLCLNRKLMCGYVEIFAFSIPCIAIQLL